MLAESSTLVMIDLALIWISAALASTGAEPVPVQRPTIQRPAAQAGPTPTVQSPTAEPPTASPPVTTPAPEPAPEPSPEVAPEPEPTRPPARPTVQRPAAMPAPVSTPAATLEPEPEPPTSTFFTPTSTDPLGAAAIEGFDPDAAQMHDPFADAPEAPGPSRRDIGLAAGLWGGAAATVVVAVVVQTTEVRVTRKQCFDDILDFNCTKPSPVIGWAHLGAVALWASAAGLVAGGTARVAKGARSPVDRGIRFGFGAALVVGGVAGVIATTVRASSAKRDCEDSSCHAQAVKMRAVTTDLSMLPAVVGSGVLGSAIPRRSRARVSASLHPEALGLALTGAF